ncbi:unnamed protein product [Lactuca virosa]|uniref:Uncharacterized protein n=1 Tax=Lactuca virosa TaxID=75947 RepID=A0AAU9PQG8_9ASTR|nr:unnamed protein product [Lactuca virosa]
MGAPRGVTCIGDINWECPNELQALGGCNSPCTMFKTDGYYCTSGAGNCRPTNYSRVFKIRCHDAYSYPMDDRTSTFTCPNGTLYFALRMLFKLLIKVLICVLPP